MAEKPVVRYIIITAALTAVVSGLIAAMIDAHISRAKPEITINSVAFRGPLQGERIELNDDLITMSIDSPWIDEHKRFETYEKLLKTDETLSETLAQLDEATTSVQAWEKQHASSITPQGAIPPADLLQHPLLKEEVLLGAALGGIRLKQVGQPPLPMNMVTALPLCFDFYPDPKGNGWMIDLGAQSVRLPSSGMSESMKQSIELFGQSIAHCSYGNIKYYADTVLTRSQNDMLQLQKFQRALRAILLPRTSLAAVVTIHNSGKSAITFRPFFALKLMHEEFKNRSFTMATEAPAKGRNPFALTSNGFTIDMTKDDIGGKRVMAKPFLAEASTATYITVPPGELREVTLVSTEPLANDADAIKRIHDTHLLSCRLVGTTSSGNDYWSGTADFSEQVGKEEKIRLASLAPRWWHFW